MQSRVFVLEDVRFSLFSACCDREMFADAISGENTLAEDMLNITDHPSSSSSLSSSSSSSSSTLSRDQLIHLLEVAAASPNDTDRQPSKEEAHDQLYDFVMRQTNGLAVIGMLHFMQKHAFGQEIRLFIDSSLVKIDSWLNNDDDELEEGEIHPQNDAALKFAEAARVLTLGRTRDEGRIGWATGSNALNDPVYSRVHKLKEDLERNILAIAESFVNEFFAQDSVRGQILSSAKSEISEWVAKNGTYTVAKGSFIRASQTSSGHASTFPFGDLATRGDFKKLLVTKLNNLIRRFRAYFDGPFLTTFCDSLMDTVTNLFRTQMTRQKRGAHPEEVDFTLPRM